MTIFLGADHGGFLLKETCKQWLTSQGFTVVDKGAFHHDPLDDYPDFAQAVALEVSKNNEDKGIVFCRGGVGVCVTANKIKGIRAGVGSSVQEVQAARNDDDMNVLAIAADYMKQEEIFSLITTFLKTPFSNEERHVRRLKKIALLE